MPKNPDERIEMLEKKVNLYRVLVVLLFFLILIVEIKPIHNMIDRMRGWVETVSGSRS